MKKLSITLLLLFLSGYQIRPSIAQTSSPDFAGEQDIFSPYPNSPAPLKPEQPKELNGDQLDTLPFNGNDYRQFGTFINGVSLGCIENKEGPVKLALCSSRSIGFQALPYMMAIVKLSIMQEVTDCAHSKGYDTEKENLKSMTWIVVTGDEVKVLCRGNNIAGCHYPTNLITQESANSGTIVMPYYGNSGQQVVYAINIFKHEFGHLLEQAILGCETHYYGSIAEECGRCDNQYGEIQQGTCSPSQIPKSGIPGNTWCNVQKFLGLFR